MARSLLNVRCGLHQRLVLFPAMMAGVIKQADDGVASLRSSSDERHVVQVKLELAIEDLELRATPASRRWLSRRLRSRF